MDFLNSLKDKLIIDGYEQNHFHEYLSQHYEQVILRGTQLPNSLKIFFEMHLIKTRLVETAEKLKHDSLKERKEILGFLIDELNTHKEHSDGVFVFICRCIASKIHILKNQLKYTYDEIPWEEMEFYLVTFIAGRMGRDCTFISHLLLDREKILCCLNDFYKALRTQNSKPYKSKTKPTNRLSIKSSVLSIHPQFDNLYENFETLRDIYSLRRMQSYMNVALTSIEGRMKPHAIERTLQVIGENLKNTRDSPNISLETKDRLLNFAPKYLKDNLTSLRDVLSHLNFINASELPNIAPLPDNAKKHPLRRILIALRNIFFAKNQQEDIVNDLKEVYVGIATVLFEELLQFYKENETSISLTDGIFTKECEKFTEIIRESHLKSSTCTLVCNEFHKMNYKQIMAVYKLRSELKGLNYRSNIYNLSDFESASGHNLSKWIFETSTMIQKFGNNSEGQQIITMDGYDIFSFPVKELRSIADYKKELEGVNDEESALQKVDDICLKIEGALEGAKEKQRLYKKLEELKALHFGKTKILKDQFLSKDEYQEIVQEFPSKIAKTLEKLCPNNDLEAIKSTVNRVYDAYGVLAKSVSTEGVICVKNYRSLLSKFCKTLNLKNHSGVVDQLVKDFKKEIEKYSEDTLSQLIEIMNTFAIDNNDLRMISIEMLLLDLLEVIISTYNFTDNTTFLERAAPILIGKNLRNYLAHGSPLIDTFSFDPRNSIEIHCTLLKEKSLIFDEKVNYGQTTTFALENAKKVYQERLAIIKNQTEMFEAARQGKLEKVDECVQNGADPLAFDVNGENGLKCAVKANNVELLKYFLDHSVEDDVENLLECAAENGCDSIVKYLLKNNQQAKNCMLIDNKLLHLAVLNDKQSMVRLLLNSGCDANALACERTPLYIAALKGLDVVADILIKHNASVLLNDSFGEQPLHAAAKSGSWKCAEMLLNEGADVVARNNVGYTALHLAAMFGRAEFIDKLLQRDVIYKRIENVIRNSALFLAASHGHEKCVEVLFEHNAQPHIRSKNLQTPLHVATYFGYRGIVKQLLKHGASVRDKDLNSCTALHFAAFRGWADLIKPLFKPGLKTKRLETPLHLAAYGGNKETVEVVLECEKEVIDNVDLFGRTALYVAAFQGKADEVKVLIQAGANPNVLTKERNTAFLGAIKAGHFEVVSNFLQLCKITRQELNCGLYLAVTYDHDECLVEMLLNAGGDPNFEAQLKSTAVEISAEEEINEEGIIEEPGHPLWNQEPVGVELPVISGSCLVAAAQSGNVNTVKLLLKNGADLNDLLVYQEFIFASTKRIPYTFLNFLDVRELTSEETNNSYSCHCLHIASAYGYTEIIELLLKQYNVDKNIKDSNEFTPLWYAVNNNHKSAVQLLLKAGADPYMAHSFHQTLLHKAHNLGYAHIAQLLLYHEDASNKRRETAYISPQEIFI